MTFLETKRLLFRSHEPQDRDAFVRMQTDPEVRRYVGRTAWSPERALQRFRDQYLRKPSKVYGLWATVLAETNEYIGCCGLRYRSHGKAGKTANLAYYLAHPYWRRGFATEASEAFIDVAFSRLHLAVLYADVEKGNDASEHILQKLSFAQAGREEIPGRVFHLYHLPKDEWQRRNSLPAA